MYGLFPEGRVVNSFQKQQTSAVHSQKHLQAVLGAGGRAQTPRRGKLDVRWEGADAGFERTHTCDPQTNGHGGTELGNVCVQTGAQRLLSPQTKATMPPHPAVCPDLAARGRVRESWCRDKNEEPRGAASKGLNIVQSLKVHSPLNC